MRTSKRPRTKAEHSPEPLRLLAAKETAFSAAVVVLAGIGVALVAVASLIWGAF